MPSRRVATRLQLSSSAVGVAGTAAGSKYEKAIKLGVNVLDEAGLLQLLQN